MLTAKFCRRVHLPALNLDICGADRGRHNLRTQRCQTVQILQMYGLTISPLVCTVKKLSLADIFDSEMSQECISGLLPQSAYLLNPPQFKMKRNPRKLKWTKAFRVNSYLVPVHS